MADAHILYVGSDDSEAVDPRDLGAELPSLDLRVTASLDAGEITEHTECVVCGCVEADVVGFLSTLHAERPGLPFVLYGPAEEGSTLGSVLEADRTAVVRRRDRPEDAAILANRIRTLVDSYRNDERLREERDRFETLFEVLTQPTVEVEFDGEVPIILRANRAFGETFGYDSSELVGESLDDVVVPPGREDEAKEINDRVLDGEVFSIEVTRQAVDGERSFLLQNAVYPDSDREFAMYTDITERKERERELRETKEKLEASNEKLRRKNERLDQFASMVSHDLRNPLTIAQLQLEFATETGEGEHFVKLQEALDRMEAMIDDLLTLARMKASVGEPEPVLLGERARKAWRTAGTAGGELTIATPEGFELDADPELLRHVLENLFSNAVDHNEPAPTITVGALGCDAGFYVEDDGRGIPPEERVDVFEYGYTTQEGGTGLGLSIVEDIVAIHGWEVSVTDGPAGGARFEIRCSP